MSADVLRRLEAVAARLEAYASSLPEGGSSSSSGPKRVEVKEAKQVVAYGAYYANAVLPFIATCRATTETAYVADLVETAFKHVGVVIQAATKCKKPAAAALMSFIGPVANSIQAAEKKVDNRSPWMPHQKALAEGLQALNWIVAPGTAKDIVQNGLEQADFYLNKILVAAKTKTGDEQKNLRDYVNNFKAMLNQLGDYANEWYTTGLDWSPKGIDISAFTPSSSSSSSSAAAAPAEEAGGAPPPPPGPPPSAEDLSSSETKAPAAAPAGGAAPGMGAVFSSINKGLDVTKGLRKVDASMKTKNMKDVPVLAPKDRGETKAPAKAGAAAAPAAKKPPKLELSKGTWFCENYEDATLTISDVEIKQSVYILKARNCTISIPDKCKSISVDGCFKTRIIFRSVVSNFELFNSQRCVADCQEVFPCIAIDKSNGCIVVCSRAGLAAPPQIVTSNISECNIQVPGVKEDDDPIEIPIPEQFETHLVPGGPPHRLRTNPIAHGE